MKEKMDMSGVGVNITTPLVGGLINAEAMGLGAPTANLTTALADSAPALQQASSALSFMTPGGA